MKLFFRSILCLVAFLGIAWTRPLYVLQQDGDKIVITASNQAVTVEGWAPGDLGTNVVAWYASDYILLTDALVYEWTDTSGNGRHFRSFTSYAPALVMTGINNRAALRFDGQATNYMTITGSTWSNVQTIAFVATMASTIPAYGTLIGNDGDRLQIRNNGTAGLGSYRGPGTGYDANDYTYNDNQQTINGTTGRLVTVDVPHIGVFSRGDTLNLTNFNNIVIGRASSSLKRYWSGYLGEMIFFQEALADNEKQKVEAYLAWKWGLQTNLPALHPYKNFPPLKP